MEYHGIAMFLHVFDYFWMIKIDQAPRMLGQQKPATQATQAAPAVPAVPGNCPAEEDNAVCLDFFCALRGIYCDVLSCIEILGYCELL